MAVSREQYEVSLAQLRQAAIMATQQATVLKLQDQISQLFMHLNDSTTKETCIPHGVFAENVCKSTAYFKCSENGEIEITVHRAGNHHWADSPENFTCYFVDGELEQLCKEWTDDCCKIKVKSWKIIPAWFFAGCEPKVTEPVVSVASVSATQPAEPAISVIAPQTSTEPTVSVSPQ